MKIFDRKPEFIAATCPHCGGKLELDINFEVAYCKDCGIQCIIKNARKRIKRTPLEKILEFTERQYNINRQDIQESKRMSLENEKIRNEIKEKRREERNIWWSKHWLKVTIISLIVFVISLMPACEAMVAELKETATNQGYDIIEEETESGIQLQFIRRTY